MDYKDKVVVVTGAGGGLGKSYALFFASKGAKVVVNDLGGSLKGEGSGQKAADDVVQEITAAGGSAVANYDSVENGDRIIQTAVDHFGTVHILINNAGILRDVAFRNMKDQEWELVQKVHVRGAYKCTKACWPLFRKQSYGRVINTASPSGLYGSFGQTNYSAAKLGLVAFTRSLSKEGAKYNIIVNAIAPTASSRMTETVFPEEMLKQFDPKYIVPVVGYLAHESNTTTGAIFDLGAGFVSRVRYQKAKGALLKADQSLTPSAILKKWQQVNDFSEPAYPEGLGETDYLGMLETAAKFSANEQGPPLDFKDQVVVVTGAGGGLGRAYALLFSKMGAKVVVNDVVNPDGVVNEINQAGGTAVGDKNSVDNGEAVIKTALDAFGTIHVLVNNAGILRDKAFNTMTDQQWDDVQNVHVRGTYKCTKAAWSTFHKQQYGRIINTSSASGLYGNFGQTNYSTAKLQILGFSQALALEGAKYNIKVNAIAPNAGTAMTRTIMPEELVQAFKPEYVAPLVALLGHDQVPCSGHVFEVGSGWIGRVRWQRSGGYGFSTSQGLTPEGVHDKWHIINDFDDGRATNPGSTRDAMGPMLMNAQTGGIGQGQKPASSKGGEGNVVQKALNAKYEPTEYHVTDRDIILYNLGIGARRTDLKWAFEGDTGFEAIPSFGVIPQFPAQTRISYGDFLPNFNPMNILHGEQYLEIVKYPIPTSGKLFSTARVVEVQDKGKAAVVVIETLTRDESDALIFKNQGVIFVRGSGGFGGESKASDRGNATAPNQVPSRQPDHVVEEKTSPDQAALYRLSGDYNPLHIDPSWKMFEEPILHGLCTFGYSTKHIYQTFGKIKNIKARFASHVFPKETLRTEMWKDGNKVIFQTRVVERNTIAISAAAAELSSEQTSQTASNSQAGTGHDEVNVPGFQCSQILADSKVAFETMSSEERSSRLKRAAGVFQLDVTNKDGKSQTWTIEAKKEGKVVVGTLGSKPDCTIIISDAKLMDIATGKGNPQKMFMQGQYKVKGNLMKSQALTGLLNPPKSGAPSKPESASKGSPAGGDIQVEGFECSKMLADAKKTFEGMSASDKAQRIKKASGVFQLEVTNKQGKKQTWTIDAKKEGKVMLGKGEAKADCIIIIDDAKLMDIATGKGNPQRMFMQGQYKVKGNLMKSQALPGLLQPSKKGKL